MLDLVDYKRLVPKAEIVGCKGKEVVFMKQEFDLIIMSTGYKVSYPFLPKRYADVGIRQRYKFVFDMEDPSLAFVGLVRPVVGSLVTLSELQAQWVANVFSKHVPMLPLQERQAAVREDDIFWSNYFKHTSQRIEGLVEASTYGDNVAKLANVYPDYWALFKRNPRY